MTTTTERQIALAGDVRGRTEIVHEDRGSLCKIYNARGEYLGMFRIGETVLQWSTALPSDKPKTSRAWQDATDLWPRFPKWIRDAVTEALHLHPVF
jgi:hypothetical protein